MIIGLFLWYLVPGNAAGQFDGSDGVQVWAVLMLRLMGASIVIGIVLVIVMAIVIRVVTGEKPDLARDERDRAISGIRWTVQGIVTAIGMVGAVGALALGQEIITAMNLILSVWALGDTAGNLAKLYVYRRGL